MNLTPKEENGTTPFTANGSMRTILSTILLVTLLPLSACGLLTGSDWTTDEGGFSAQAAATELKLRNRSGATVQYWAVEEEASTVLDLLVGPEGWPGLEHGEDAAIPYSQIAGYDEDAERIVVFWYREGRFRSFKVEL